MAMRLEEQEQKQLQADHNIDNRKMRLEELQQKHTTSDAVDRDHPVTERSPTRRGSIYRDRQNVVLV